MSEQTSTANAIGSEATIRFTDGGVEVTRGGEPVELTDEERATIMRLAPEAPTAPTPRPPDDDRRREFEALMESEEADEEFEPWADQLYGAMVKNARKKAGYGTAQAFSDTIYRRTRYRIGRDTLYKIEQGRQTPDVRQFIAINIALFDTPFPASFATASICPEWIAISNTGGEIPMAWRKRNTLELEEETGELFYSAKDAARAAKDEPKLFGYGTAPEPK